MTIAGIKIDKQKLDVLQNSFSILQNTNATALIKNLPGTTRTLSKITGINEQTTNKILLKLFDCKILERKQEGKQKLYTLNKDRTATLFRIADQLSEKERSLRDAYNTIRKINLKQRLEILNTVSERESTCLSDLPGNRTTNSMNVKALVTIGVLDKKREGKYYFLSVNKGMLRKIFF